MVVRFPHFFRFFSKTMTHSEILRRTCCALLLTTLCFGCNQGPRNGKPIVGSPDGSVTQLTLGTEGTIEHNEGKFLELVQRTDQKLILVDFWASWCGPCRQLGPTLEKIKAKWGDNIEVVKVDVDQCPEISESIVVVHR
jgi:thiol-disulfide isomerase/thioredoxin